MVYCVLTVISAFHYRTVAPPALKSTPGISVLKPLAGAEEELERNLRSFFEQKYPEFEVLFAVRDAADPAVAVAERVRAQYPHIPSRLIVTGEPPYPNAKVYSLDRMLSAARYELIVMSDSDIRVTPAMLATLAAEFQDPAVGLVTCPYRAVPGNTIWSLMEALGLNTEFIGGVLVARLLDGMKFALGPTIAARRLALEEIGGFDVLKDYLAEDFVMGKQVAARGWRVLLSSYVIEHHIGSQAWQPNLKHRLRWNRSTRRSRPWGYIGQVFTNPLPLALLLWACRPAWWSMAVLAVLLRMAAAWATAGYTLQDRLVFRCWWLLPIQDIASLLTWIGGFLGNRIVWRGRKYDLLPDGRFELVK
jgi:ceramide glucosyltransferase